MGLKFKKLRHNLFSVMITDVKDVLMQLGSECSPGAGRGLELDPFFSAALCP